VVQVGLNIQPDQELVIFAPIETASFVHMVTDEAYLAGAKDVIVTWDDEISRKQRLVHASIETLSEVAPATADLRMYYQQRGAAFLSVHAADPTLMSDVDKKKIGAWTRARAMALKPFNEKLDSGENVWCVISIPTAAWAKQVFPEKTQQEAIDALWEAIFTVTRIGDGDPVEKWHQHMQNLSERAKFLTEKQFVKLHYTNSLGTDLDIGLPKNHIWGGALEKCNNGTIFVPNMPTEEVFSAPDCDNVNGVVKSALPLIYQGNRIDGFSLTFQNGRVVDYSAKEGEEVLTAIFESDERARYLGEVALVPYHSPISQSGILFYNTLFDENAACHLALGEAYPTCIEGGTKMDAETLLQHHLNVALLHEDFMVGTSDLKIVGLDADGNETLIFENGDWAF
jgi:aminopeptidase